MMTKVIDIEGTGGVLTVPHEGADIVFASGVVFDEWPKIEDRFIKHPWDFEVDPTQVIDDVSRRKKQVSDVLPETNRKARRREAAMRRRRK